MSVDVIAATRDRGCRCEDERFMAHFAPHAHGYLRPGMLVSDLVLLGAGCTEGRWVCPRLDKIRRRYGR